MNANMKVQFFMYEHILWKPLINLKTHFNTLILNNIVYNTVHINCHEHASMQSQFTKSDASFFGDTQYTV